MEPHFYEVNVAWSKDRKGILCSPDLNSPSENGCIEVATPPNFPKGIPGIWSPEHLFTAAVSSCFMTTFLSIAENSKLEFLSFSCRSQGRLDKLDGRFMMTEVLIEPVLMIAFEHDRDRAMRILKKTEAGCLITNSIKSTVTMRAVIRIQGQPAQQLEPL